ncbi:hypothetical protein M514_26845 [Trichuris suis]|uniref:Uncharacterized protein n=1 Tax=Trichuris suis TaxID=68888 RepID=A0A085MUQ1_9BILA|nr:hypothetical protein M514_26845 [Trichuris suis]
MKYCPFLLCRTRWGYGQNPERLKSRMGQNSGVFWIVRAGVKFGLPIRLRNTWRDRGIGEGRCAVPDTMMDELSVICPAGGTRIVASLSLNPHTNPPGTMQWYCSCGTMDR